MKICVFTGTRAEYGLLTPIMKLIKEDRDCELQLVVTGAHLSDRHGYTAENIETDGFTVNAEANILIYGDTREGIVRSLGLGVMLFTDILKRLEPDAAVVLGDRYEMLAAAETCFFMGIPVVHLYGGELTEGAFDDAIRHSITKLSGLHVTSTEKYRQRVIQLGEHPDRVFNAGSLGTELIKSLNLMTRGEVDAVLKISAGKKIILFTYHPETNDNMPVDSRFENILEALDDVLKERSDTVLVITGANADPGGLIINGMARDFCRGHQDRAVYFESMGQLRYLSTMKYASVIAGNSSSGIMEAPSFRVPTVNIGRRQEGRIRAQSVMDCGYGENEFKNVLENALDIPKDAFADMTNPYEQDGTSEKIFKIIKSHHELAKTPKKFYDLS